MKYVECVDGKRTFSAYYHEKLRSGARVGIITTNPESLYLPRVFGSFCFVGVTKLYRFYTNNLNKFTAYPDDIEQRATAMFLLLAKKLAEKENVTEQLKSTNQMKWVAWMNNIRSSATEIVNNDIIYN